MGKVSDVVAADLGWKDKILVCKNWLVERPLNTPTMWVSWDAVKRPRGFVEVGPGAVFALQKDVENHPMYYSAQVAETGPNRYTWTYSNSHVESFDMKAQQIIALVFPPEYIGVDIDPRPFQGKVTRQNRLAVYWSISPKTHEKITVNWKIRPEKGDLKSIARAITKAGSMVRSPAAPKPTEYGAAPAVPLNLWVIGGFYLCALVVVVAAFAALFHWLSGAPAIGAAIIAMLAFTVVVLAILRTNNLLKEASFERLLKLIIKNLAAFAQNRSFLPIDHETPPKKNPKVG